ncbi:TraR/DksA family transcriptional regulator [Aquihabitans daechungensis]|uniref:TraR/DksA family transcriptional regulator n=1 Tax=Aquihabitans daechungensis TaxID=1052257 RepID=UPI003BA22559
MATDRSWGEALVRFELHTNPENNLDADQIEHFRSLLLGSLDEIVERIAAVKAVRRVRRGSSADSVDALLADRVEAHRTEIELVSSALLAIDAGVYGVCLRCHLPVGFEELLVRPTTTLCRACAEPQAPSAHQPDERRPR